MGKNEFKQFILKFLQLTEKAIEVIDGAGKAHWLLREATEFEKDAIPEFILGEIITLNVQQLAYEEADLKNVDPFMPTIAGNDMMAMCSDIEEVIKKYSVNQDLSYALVLLDPVKSRMNYITNIAPVHNVIATFIEMANIVNEDDTGKQFRPIPAEDLTEDTQ